MQAAQNARAGSVISCSCSNHAAAWPIARRVARRRAACAVQPQHEQQSGSGCHHRRPPLGPGGASAADGINTAPTSSGRPARSNGPSGSGGAPRLGRRALGAAAAAAAAASLAAAYPPPSSAQIVDEAVAQAVFESARDAVVAVVDFKINKAGAEAFEPLGSGLVFDNYGHVVTNYHVISKYVLDRAGAVGLKIVLERPDGTTYALPVSIVGTDAMKDLAVLGITGDTPPELRPLPLAASASLKVGQSVYALGARYGEGKSLSAGVVSGLERAIPAPTGTRIYGVIQTDASINAANSGGALVDSFGHLVGLSTAIFTNKSTGRGSGVSFALPTEVLLEAVPNLIVYGSSSGRGVRGATPS